MPKAEQSRAEQHVRRRIFPRWSIAIPPSLTETFDTEGGYWHAYAADRSVSVSSIVLTEDEIPVAQHRILEQMQPPEGEAVDALPPGLPGWAVAGPAVPPARADRMLQGLLARDGCVAVVTITTDDAAWASAVWTSIRSEDPADAVTDDRSQTGARRRDHRLQ